MKHHVIGISLFALISVLLLPSCSKKEYNPMQANSQECAVEIVCTGPGGTDMLADKSFAGKIKVEGGSSHSDLKFNIITTGKQQCLRFEADIPDSNDMKWSADRGQASGMSKVTVRFGQQKVTLKCLFKYTANRPPLSVGGSLVLESVECNGRTYNRSGKKVSFAIDFDRDGKIR